MPRGVKKKSQKVSVIIPNYNGAKYLADCINSVRAQTYPNVEIILVDDNSTDDSFEIAGEIAARDPRVIAKRMPGNSSVGAARNYGIDISTGDFIMFLDSDDIMSPIAIETLTCIQNAIDSDITGSEYTRVPECFHIPGFAHFPLPDFKFTFFGNDIFEYNRMTDPISFVVVWGKLIRREIMNDLRFLRGVHPHEDTDFMLRLYARARSIAATPVQIVYYRMSLTSVMGRKTHDQSRSVIRMLQSLAIFLRSVSNGGRKYAKFIRYFVYWFMWDYVSQKARRNAQMRARAPGIMRMVWRLGLMRGVRMPLFNRIRLWLIQYGIGWRTK